jgi:hypothetical protein
MSLWTALLNQTADLERPLSGEPDRFGQPSSTFEAFAVAIPCRIVAVTGKREILSPITREVQQTDWKLFLPPDVDLRELDRVAVVRDRHNNVIAQDCRVVAVNKIPGAAGTLHHIEALLIEEQD